MILISLPPLFSSSASDTDDDADMSDHDLTPCNASPSLPYSWPGGGGHQGASAGTGPESGVAGGASGRLLEQEAVEDMWKAHVTVAMQNPSNEALMETFFAFGKLFNVRTVKKFQNHGKFLFGFFCRNSG